MVVKNTAQIGNPVIRAKAKKVEIPFSSDIKKVIKDLVDSMREHELVGMAAPQIGKSLRIFVTEVRATKLREKLGIEPDQLRVFINPVIKKSSKKELLDWEGCGSVACAGLFGKVKRAKSVTIAALNEKGEKFELELEGLLARVIQHEMDHLNGIVFTDRSDPRTYMSLNEYLRMRKEEAEASK